MSPGMSDIGDMQTYKHPVKLVITGASLSIGQHAGVVALHHVLDDWRPHGCTEHSKHTLTPAAYRHHLC